MSSFNKNNKFPSVIDNFLDSKIQKINPKAKNAKLIDSNRQLVNLPLPNINYNNIYERMINKSREKRKIISLEQIYKTNKHNNNKILKPENKLVSNNTYNNFANFTNDNDRFKSIKNSNQLNYFSNNDNLNNNHLITKPLKNSQSIYLDSVRMNKKKRTNENFREINNNNINYYNVRRTPVKFPINKFESYNSIKDKNSNMIKIESIQNFNKCNEKDINIIQNENIQLKDANEKNVQKDSKDDNNMFITRINFAKNINKFNKSCEKNYPKKKNKDHLFKTVNFGDLLMQLRENKKMISQNQNELEVMIKTAKDAQKELWHICDKNK